MKEVVLGIISAYLAAPSTAAITAHASMPACARHLPLIAADQWEDVDGDLYVPGYICTEIEPRHWEIGERQETHAQVINPISAN